MLGSAPGPAARLVQRLTIASTSGPLRPAGIGLYRLVARAAAAALARGEDAAVYARSGTSSPDLVPGISDIDLAVVVADDPAGSDMAAERIRRRWGTLVGRAPLVGRLVELPMVYDATDLAELTGPSYATWGLDLHPRSRPAFAPGPALLDWRRRLERPGLYDDLGDWRLLRGRDLRPHPATRTRDEELIAAWLELNFWWWFALEAAKDPSRPHVGLLCKKLVAEPERVRLWLEDGERQSGRTAILQRLAREAGPEQEAAAAMLTLDVRSARESPLDLALASLTRQSEAIAAGLDAEAFASGRTSVRLVGTRALIPAVALDSTEEATTRSHTGGAWPLCDWQSLVATAWADESFVLTAEAPTTESVARAAAVAAATAPTMRVGPLLLFPRQDLFRPLPRRVACAATDPVSFALLSGREEAVFPGLRGMSVADVAERAVMEQRRRVAGRHAPAGARVRVVELAVAARAALLHESVEEGSPTLPLTVLGTLAMLGERLPDGRDACAEAGEALAVGGEPAASAVSRLEQLVGSLPAYRD